MSRLISRFVQRLSQLEIGESLMVEIPSDKVQEQMNLLTQKLTKSRKPKILLDYEYTQRVATCVFSAGVVSTIIIIERTF